jgi:hypothetical protein
MNYFKEKLKSSIQSSILHHLTLRQDTNWRFVIQSKLKKNGLNDFIFHPLTSILRQTGIITVVVQISYSKIKTTSVTCNLICQLFHLHNTRIHYCLCL